MLTWIAGEEALHDAVRRHRGAMDAADAHVDGLVRLPGYCSVCDAGVGFIVDIGVYFGPHPNLREGLVCPSCGLNNRNRLVMEAVGEVALPASPRGLVLEATTLLFFRMSARLPWLEGSEYFGEGHAPGERVALNGRQIPHRSITALGIGDAELDLLVHNDVLEHVADTRGALAECRRVLRPGGACVFTMPFFPLRATTLVRGRHRPDGVLEHLEPPEYHGDGIRPEGIYTYYHFGRDLLGLVEEAGFRRVEVGLDFDLFRGHTSNNYRFGDDAWMPPVVLRAIA
jgi:SAM-dependent methyltransferase